MVQPRERRPLQFGLRWLFVITALVAAFFSVACVAGYIEASGALVALTVLAGAIGYRLRGWFLVVRSLAAVAALGLLWFVAVDECGITELCNHCRSERHLRQYRVFAFVTSETVDEYRTPVSMIAQDLGAPCPHEYERVPVYRTWGLLYYISAGPCGLFSLVGEDWHDKHAARIVRSRGQACPELAEEFRRKVLFDHDLQYSSRFIEELREAKAGKQGTAQDPVEPDE